MSRSSRAVLAALAASIAASIAATPSALARGGVYGGTTSGQEAIVLRTDAKAKTLKSAVLGWTARCPDGRRFTDGGEVDAADLDLTRNRRGRFAGEWAYAATIDSSSAMVTVKIDGTFRGKRASGAIRAKVEMMGYPTVECDTSAMRWKATRGAGRVFGGRTSQDWPIVVKVDKARHNVDDIDFGWGSESCVPDGYFHTPDSLTDFPIKSRRFGDVFSSSYDTDDGGKQTYDYDVSGTVARTTASGRFHVKVSETDAAGAQQYSCDTGSVSWNARTG